MTVGTEGDDFLSNDLNVNPETVDALGGDDIVSIQVPGTLDMIWGDVFVNGGTGADTLRISGHRINGSASSPFSGSLNYFSPGTSVLFIAYDSIERIEINGGIWSELETGDSIDFINVTDSEEDGAIVRVGGGNDRVTVSLPFGARVYGGEGDDILQDTSDGTTFGFSAGDSLFGEAGNDQVTGGYERDVLSGGDGDDRLDGGMHVDVMNGGSGNDVFVVDHGSESVIEYAGGGLDTVQSSSSFWLSNSYELENLTLIGAAAINGAGNNLSNVITGNGAANHLRGLGGDDMLMGGAGDDVLEGGLGVDILTGGTGNDRFVVDGPGDSLIESPGGGVDTVESSGTFWLSGTYELENLTLTGTAAANGSGNDLANLITGNGAANHLRGLGGADTLIGGGGNDVLDGMSGTDHMEGGLGDDRYVVDSASDTLEEAVGGGNDLVFTLVDYRLAAGVEVETLRAADISSTAPLVLVGNEYAQAVLGNAGDNLIDGGQGSDLLGGGAGADAFFFTGPASSWTGVDTITDFFAADDAFHLFGDSLDDGEALAESAFRQGKAAADAEDRILYDGATGRIWYDTDGSGAQAAILFAVVTPGTQLSHADFFLAP